MSRNNKNTSTLALLTRFLREAFTHRRTLAIAVVSIIGATLATLASPYILKVAIDEYILKGRYSDLWRISLLYLAALIAQWGFTTLQTLYTEVFGQKVLWDLRAKLYDKVLASHLNFFKERSTGDLVSRIINDTSMVNDVLVSGLLGGISDLLSITGIIAAMLLLDVRLTAAVLLVIPPMTLIARYFGGKIRESYRETRRRIAGLSSIVEETVSGIETVKAFGREKEVEKIFSRAALDTVKAYIRVAIYMGLFWPLMSLTSLLAVVIVVGYGGYLVAKGAASIGVVVAFIQYAQRFRGPINNVVSMYDSLQSALAALERIYEVIDDERVERLEGRPVERLRGEIVFKDIWFEYERDRPVLRGVTLRIAPGSRVAIVGETGAGKTTMASLIMRFYEPQRGEILYDGTPGRLLDGRSLRMRIGYVPQETYLFPGTILENILIANPKASREDVERVCRELGVHEFIEKLPKGYDTPAGEAGRLLSVGERQLIAIARAMLRDPDIVILDEALSSVDPATEQIVTRALLKLMEGRTSVIIAHRLSITRYADEIVAVKDGVIIERGTPEELLRRKGYYYRLYTSQTEGLRTMAA